MIDERIGRSFLWVENIENAAFAQELTRLFFKNPALDFGEVQR